MNTDINDLGIPLCVDLDGTLIKTDLLYESILYLLKKNFFYIFFIPFWLMKGRYYIKFKLAGLIIPNIASLPKYDEVIDYVKSEKSKGRKIVLVTAASEPAALKAAEYFNLFDEVLASKNSINLIGQAKSDALVSRFGENGFDYIGDSFKDIFVWKSCRKVYVVSDNLELINEVKKERDIEKTFYYQKNKLAIIIKQMRVHQWIKNLLLFVPPLLAHKIYLGDYLYVVLGFFSFSFTASAIYIVNDLADIESDRNHVTKKNRPAASGRIKILTCLKLIPILLIMGYGLSLFMPNNNFLYILIAYTIITVYYSFKLKKIYLLDMITLSLLYTTRVVSGGIASDTFLSPWLFSFTMFMFISLGAMKRYTELKGLIKLNKTKPGGRDYHVEDIPLINTIGISAAFVSAVIFTLYIDSPNVVRLYNNPLFLYVITPVILYWLLRMWFIAHRGMMDEDPIVFMIKDKVSYITFAIISLISIMAAI